MKVFWWQSGLHFEPESKKEFEALAILSESLNIGEFREKVESGPISGADFCNEKPILRMDVLS